MGRDFSSSRELGARAYAAGDWATAEEHFGDAIAAANRSSNFSSDDSLELAKCHSNRAAARTQMMKWSQAAVDARICTALAPNWPKGFTRLGVALHEMNKLDEAKSALEQALRLDPSSASAHETLQKVNIKLSGQPSSSSEHRHRPPPRQQNQNQNQNQNHQNNLTFIESASNAWYSLDPSTRNMIAYGALGFAAYYVFFSWSSMSGGLLYHFDFRSIFLMGMMYYGWRQGMSPFQLLWLFQMFGGGGGGGFYYNRGRRRRPGF